MLVFVLPMSIGSFFIVFRFIRGFAVLVFSCFLRLLRGSSLGFCLFFGVGDKGFVDLNRKIHYSFIDCRIDY